MDQRQENVAMLKERARAIRLHIIDLVGTGRAGHLGGSCSAADVVAALYFGRMAYRPEDPAWEGRDLSLIHISPGKG